MREDDSLDWEWGASAKSPARDTSIKTFKCRNKILITCIITATSSIGGALGLYPIGSGFESLVADYGRIKPVVRQKMQGQSLLVGP